jgi:hypothetical protein
VGKLGKKIFKKKQLKGKRNAFGKERILQSKLCPKLFQNGKAG